MIDLEISDWNYIMSALGNAYFSGLDFDQVWSIVVLSSNREEFDIAISAQIKLLELVNMRTKAFRRNQLEKKR